MTRKAKKGAHNQDDNQPSKASDVVQIEPAPQQECIMPVAEQKADPSLDETTQRYEPVIKIAFEQSKEVLTQIQMKMASLALMEAIAIEQRTQMSGRDLFLVGLSFLKIADILWMSGLMSERDYKMYNCFENRKMVDDHKKILSYTSVQLLESQKKQRVRISFPLIAGSFEEVQEYALEKGYVFDVLPESVLVANQLKKSAQLCEMLMTNVRGVFLDTQDGLPQTDWFVPNDELTTEYICLKSMILLRNGYEHEGSDALDALLYALVVNRVQCDVINMGDYVEKNAPTAEFLLTTMPYVRQLFEQVKEPNVLEINARQAFLYHAMEETQRCLEKTHPDNPEWSQWLVRWVKSRTQSIIKSMPPEISQTKLQRGMNEGNQHE